MNKHDSSEVDEIISLIRQGVDFGSMSTIRTLIDEIHWLRQQLAQLEPGERFSKLQNDFDEMEKRVEDMRKRNSLDI